MDTTPYWSATEPQPRFPALDHDLRVDVAIVGGGITGITAAYLLSEAGAKVALLGPHSMFSASSRFAKIILTLASLMSS